MNDAGRYARLKAQFLRLRELDAATREAALAQFDDADFARDVRELLERDTQDTEIEPAVQATLATPAQIGGYGVLRELSRGGMGVVYLAQRADGAYRQQVAIKVAPRAASSAEARLRFRLERQILANLDHPNIARLLDGGEVDGVPYLVMEYVAGERIDAWCRAHAANARGCVEAFLPVCAAVAYAHRHLVVHRDLKPANVLIAADGTPKLLDFGIAKLLQGAGEFGTLTGEAGSLMTPRYASPEQLSGAGVNTQSDVYSLGVVLYELLSGQSPYGTATTSPARLVKAICDAQPPPVSRAADRSRRRALEGDLDAILALALRKQPDARYAGVDAFAADLQAWLDGRPVQARRGDWWYRTRRFATAHWLVLATAGFVLALSLAFALQLAAELGRTALERDKARALSGFLLDLFQVADPGEARGNSITVREILDRGARQLPAERSLPGPVRGQMLSTLGNVYRRLGLFDAALPLLQAGEAERRTAAPEEHADALFALAALDSDRGRYASAVAQAERALAELPERSAARASVLNLLGVARLRQQDFAGARRDLDAALAAAAPDSRDRAEALASSAYWHRDRGDVAAAARDFGAAYALLERQGVDPWTRAKLANNLAIIDYDRGDLASAASRLARAQELILKVLGDRHPMFATAQANLAALENRRGRYAQADVLYAQSLKLREQVLDAHNPVLADARANLAYNRVLLDARADARALFAQALPALQALRGPRHANTLTAQRNAAALDLLDGDLAAAAATLRDVRDVASQALGPGHEITLLAQARLAWVRWLDGGAAAESRAALDAVIARPVRGAGHALLVAEAKSYRAALRLAAGDRDGCADVRDATLAFGRTLEPTAWEAVLVDALGGVCAGGGAKPAPLRLLLVHYGAAHPLPRRLADL